MPIFDEQGNEIARTLTRIKHPEYYRENKYAEARLNGANPTMAAAIAGIKPENAYRGGKQLEQRPRVQQTFRQALEQAGVNNELIAKRIRQGLGATKLITSPTEPDKTVVDFAERRQYSKLALEAMGELQSKSTVAIQINLPNDWSNDWGSE